MSQFPFYLGKRARYGILKVLLRQYLGDRVPDGTSVLPGYGNLCLPVHRGYKYFDFINGSVLKVFFKNIEESIIKVEIETIRRASIFGLSHGIRAWNEREGWYEEHMVRGHPLRGADELSKSTRWHWYKLEGCIVNILSSGKVFEILVMDHICKLIEVINSQTIDERLDGKLLRIVWAFVDKLYQRLEQEKISKIYLSLSHGDFAAVNIVMVGKRPVVIDWEHMGERSILHDLHNFFFSDSFFKSIPSKNLNNAIRSLQRRVQNELGNIHFSDSDACRAYRYVYYIERIATLICRDKSKFIIEHIKQYIEIFQEYERWNEECWNA